MKKTQLAMGARCIFRYLSEYAWVMRSLAAGLVNARDASSKWPKEKRDSSLEDGNESLSFNISPFDSLITVFLRRRMKIDWVDFVEDLLLGKRSKCLTYQSTRDQGIYCRLAVLS
jgi:hypothetical protein